MATRLHTKSSLKCYDCGGKIKGRAYTYETKAGEFHKCEKCFAKDSTLKNYQPTEVYSRIVGYMRPVEFWNLGKAQEYKERKEFVVCKN